MLTSHSLKATLAVLLTLTVFVPTASANVPSTVTKTNALRFPALGNMANGTLTTQVFYNDTHASASASTGNTIGLGQGWVFKLRTCVSYHLHAIYPLASCVERIVDTRYNSAAVYTYAPTVSLGGMPRPTTQPWGYFKAYAEVRYQDQYGKWLMSGHSWPDTGLQGAGIAVAPQGLTSGTLPANSPVQLDAAYGGAINTGEADSICTPSTQPSNGSALPAGVANYTVALAGAPAYYEVGTPTGAYAGQPAKGVMLVIHGGGWTTNGIGAVQSMRPDADRWRARGWQTVNLTYRSCRDSLIDALWFYDKTRAAAPSTKICAIGTSAGGNLALLLGVYRTGLHCAINQAGPTELIKIKSQGGYNTATGGYDQTLGGRYVHNLGVAAFGTESLGLYSPAANANGTLKTTRVLQGFSADDWIVPYAQATDLATAMRAANPAAYVDTLQLAGGTLPFGHGYVSSTALNDFYAREVAVAGP